MGQVHRENHLRVSILSQPEGRELLNRTESWGMALTFQSSPSPKAGSYSGHPWHFFTLCRFQSSPSPKAGSYAGIGEKMQAWGCFNPLPARRPGATRGDENIARLRLGFNPLPARRPGATQCLWITAIIVFVSILSQPEGRELHASDGANIVSQGFQSSPSPKAGSYITGRE